MSKICVLIVEDNSISAEATAITLKKHSMGPIHICSSGEEAIKIFKKESIDLRFDGYRSCRSYGWYISGPSAA